jgi:DNA-binding CsgD family transcriptional regulator
LAFKATAWPTPGLAGELHGIRGIAYACLGDSKNALRFADTARELSQQLESDIPASWAQVLAAPPAERELLARDAFIRTQQAGHRDTLVLAYRSEPSLLPVLSAIPEFRTSLEGLLEAARDHALARRVRIPLAPATNRSALTARESEVLDLVRQGLTNAEISRALWITEGTAKVHVRHILEKLGVRSRVEAATVPITDEG